MWVMIFSYTSMNGTLSTNEQLIEQWNRDWEHLSHLRIDHNLVTLLTLFFRNGWIG